MPKIPRIINTATWGRRGRASETFSDRAAPELICVGSGEILVAFESYFKVNSIHRGETQPNIFQTGGGGEPASALEIDASCGPRRQGRAQTRRTV
jgi:hypothetical protein